MKTLKDLSLDCVGNNLHGNIRRIVLKMAPIHKEMLLERLVCHDRLTPEYLPHITYNLFSQSLRHVNFYRSAQVTDSVLEQLSASDCRLASLTIHCCTAITEKGILTITRGQNELERLGLRKQLNITSKAMKELHSEVLRKVDLRGSHISTDAVHTIVKSNSGVSNLILSDCKGLDEAVFTIIADGLTRSLEILKIRNLHVLNDASLAKISSSCPNIIKLNLYGCNRVTEIGFAEMAAKLTKLQKLDLSYCSGLQKVESLQVFTRLSADSLRELSLCGVMLANTDSLVSAIQRLNKLRVIRLCGVPAVTDEALEKILNCVGEQLESLDLSGGLMSPLTDEGLKSIERYCHNLTKLYLGMLHLSSVTVAPILRDSKRASRLEVLQLSCKNLSEEVVHSVGLFCYNLRVLSFSGVSYIDDSMLSSIAQTCRGLTNIGLKGCRLITDEGVCTLAQFCPRLRGVVLSGIRNLTDRSVMALANSCPYIDEIYLSGCNSVSRTAISYLVDSSIPRVFFEHRTPSANPSES